MEGSPVCPQCQTDMEPAYIVDRGYGGFFVSGCLKGAPEKSFWCGLKLALNDIVPVQTFRCASCGGLKSIPSLSRAARSDAWRD
jgi:hypothetical protein